MIEHAIEILLVEDNPSDAELTLHALNKYKIANHVKLVGDGAEALDFLFGAGDYAGIDATSVPKLILLDLKLPKITGLEVLRRIKSDVLTRNIPVVVLTSSAEERDLRDAYLLGVNSYVVKPVDFKQFSEAVHQLGLYWLLLNARPEAIPHQEVVSET